MRLQGVLRWRRLTAHRSPQTYLFEYDNNGNMTRRKDDSGDFDQEWDTENRLEKVLNRGHRRNNDLLL